MKKISFNFSDFQYDEFRSLAKRDNKTFSEVVRNALDDWLMAKKKGLGIPLPTDNRPEVTIILADTSKGDDGVLYYSDAIASEIDEEVIVQRYDKIIARLNSRYVVSWYTEP